MAIQLNISGTNYDYPETRQSPGWGEAATAWAQAVTDALNGIISIVDIPITAAVIQNSIGNVDTQVGAVNVVGLAFDSSIVRGASIEYTIFRNSDSIVTPKAEKGVFEVSFDGNDWTLIRGLATADTGVRLSITNLGQVQYTSTSIPGSNYTGQIKFKASALIQS